MRNIAFLSILFFLLSINISWAQESTLTITDMKADLAIVSTGANVLISCRVSHSISPINIERVAATVSHGDWVTAYQKLYDDGTNGDVMSDDGIYSLEIKAPDNAGEAKIVFHAVDTDKNEIDSEPILFGIKCA